MTEKQWVEHFMKVLDKGIELYTEALETKKGDDIVWLSNNSIHDGLCIFFHRNYLDELTGWITSAMGKFHYLAPIARRIHGSEFYSVTHSRQERFALRLKVLKNIKKQLS